MCFASVVVELPQPVLSHGISQTEESIGYRIRADVGHPPRVPVDLYRPVDLRSYLAFGPRQPPLEIPSFPVRNAALGQAQFERRARNIDFFPQEADDGVFSLGHR